MHDILSTHCIALTFPPFVFNHTVVQPVPVFLHYQSYTCKPRILQMIFKTANS